MGKAKYLLFTHSDYDHIIGYGAFPGWTTIASKCFVSNPARESQLQQAKDWDDANYVERSYKLEYPRIDHPVGENPGRILLGASGVLRAYQAPGHNFDGLIAHLPKSGVLIVGDYLSNIEFPYVYHSFTDYRQTLDTLEKIIEDGAVDLLVTGHGDATTDREEMDLRLRESRAYLGELDQSVRHDGRPFDLERLFRRYAFPKIMKAFHDKNVALLRTEIDLR